MEDEVSFGLVRFWFEDLKDLDEEVKRSETSAGVCSCKSLKTTCKILKSTLNLARTVKDL